MKKVVVGILCTLIVTWWPTISCTAQVTEIITAVIKAADVAVQKAQNKIIDLQNAEKALENDFSETRLGEITDWTQRHLDQYKEYFNELKTVKNAITDFERVRQIMAEQVQLVNEYKQAYGLYTKDPHFSVGELETMADVYGGMIDASVRNLDQLTMVITSFVTEMTDGHRVAIIDGVGTEMDRILSDVRAYNKENALLSLQRSRSEDELVRMRALYGMN